MSGEPKSAATSLADAHKAFWLMVAAGGMFILGGVIPMIIALVRDRDLPTTSIAFLPIGALFIAIAAAMLDKARKDAARAADDAAPAEREPLA
ncbi:MAG TPA: hypothetical protein VEY69_16220 [Lautropia sp.]|nr:hypothetical protein [Lautropia sp.]